MVDLTGSARRLYLRILGAGDSNALVDPGISGAADGAAAVAAVEAAVSEAAALGAAYPAADAAVRFRDAALHGDANLFGAPLSALETAGPRAGLAAATGLALTGVRAASFLSGPELLGSLDLLRQAAERRLPLVVHLVARAGAGESAGSGHEAWHAAAGSGALQLFAANVQEAVDFTLIARRAAEAALMPALVGMDGPETAGSVQEVVFPTAAGALAYLGDPDAATHSPTPAQELLFGRHRRRVPRWHDPERPLLGGALTGSATGGLAAAGRGLYFDGHAAALLDEAFEEFATRAGRRHHPVTAYRTEDARLVLVAMGSMIEIAESTADRLRESGKLRVGVVGIRVLRPFPEAALVRALAGGKLAAVLERVETAAFAEPPLLREVRGALDRARENDRHGEGTHPGLPPLQEKDLPRLTTVFYGLAGHPVRSADVEALAAALLQTPRSPLYLGTDFTPRETVYPKRQVLVDALRRGYPEAERLGVRAAGPGSDPRPLGAFTIAVHRTAGPEGEALAPRAAAVLVRATGGSSRTRPGFGWGPWGRVVTDRVTAAPGALRDPGDETPVEIAVWLRETHPTLAALSGLADGGALLFERRPGTPSLWKSLDPAFRAAVAAQRIKLYTVQAAPRATPAEREARLLGALMGTAKAESRIDANPRKLLAAWRDEAGEAEAAFDAGRQEVSLFDPAGLPAEAAPPAPPVEREAPAAVRALGRSEGTLDSPARFWDQVRVLEQDGAADRLTPDPYLAVGTLPSLTASFNDWSEARTHFPAFDPALCTGCGACWTACPDGAVAPFALSAAALLDEGMRRARERGRSADALRAVASKLAGRINDALVQADPPGAPAGAILDQAFAKLMEKSPLSEERRTAVTEAFRSVRETVATLPMVRTAPFFGAAEKESKGSGELLTLAVNPDLCKGCGVCVAVCEPAALSLEFQTAERLAGARAAWAPAADLPAPAEATVERVRRHPAASPLAGDMLAAGARAVLSGGDASEPGSGERAAVRQILAAAVHHLKPHFSELLQRVDETREALASAVREGLAGALPTDDLDALARGLDRLERPDAGLAELAARVDSALTAGRVDVARMRRLVGSARELADVHFRLAHGAGGLGRARFGVVVAPGTAARWAGAFPDNPFAVPVTLDATGDTAAVARGLAEGQLRQAMDTFRALRRARLELERPVEAARAADALARLSWRDLSPAERRCLPPLFLVADEDAVAGSGLGEVLALLDSGLPVKLVLLADAHLGLWAGRGAGPAEASARMHGEPGLLGLAYPDVVTVQTSIAHPAHLEQGVALALAHEGPALVRVHAPSPMRHGFAADAAVARAARAVLSRAFPLFRYAPADPVGAGGRLDLAGNPAPGADWARNAAGAALTPAEWAAEELRFAACFRPLDEGDGSPVDLIDYMNLTSESRAGKTPTVGAGEGRLAVGPDLVRAVEARLAAWHLLQELAGATLPRTAIRDLKQVLEAEVAAERRAELDRVAAGHAAQTQALRSTVEGELAARVRGRLLTLVRSRAAAPPPAGANRATAVAEDA